MFLVDTNCFMQIVRERPHATEVKTFLGAVPRSQLFISDFTVHSVGVIMSRFKQIQSYVAFLEQLGIGREFSIVRVGHMSPGQVAMACVAHQLDLDDAYQFVTADMHKLKIVSFDADFDHTPTGRITPAAALQFFTDDQAKQS